MTRESYGKISLIVFLLFLTSHWLPAETVSESDVRLVARNWIAQSSTRLKCNFSNEIESIIPCFGEENTDPLFYAVNLKPEGFIIVSADTSIEPLIAFSDKGIFKVEKDQPFCGILLADLAARNMISKKIATRNCFHEMVKFKYFERNMRKWTNLKNYYSLKEHIEFPDDPRVDALLGERSWGQWEVGAQNCYNLYTPQNYPCGCTATAMSQLMKYYEFPATGIGIIPCSVTVDGASLLLNTRGGDGFGGAYDWENMPDSPFADEERVAVAAICYDAGLSVGMNYTEELSSANVTNAAIALKTIFQYTNAISNTNTDDGFSNQILTSMINTNLDANFPVLLGLYGGSLLTGYRAHAVVCDGYGYTSGTLYHHLNMGNVYDALPGNPDGSENNTWYNLPEIDSTPHDYNVVTRCVYNIFETGTGEIISGRVLDSNNQPVSGVRVSDATDTIVDYTDDRGIYALVHIPPGACNVRAVKGATDYGTICFYVSASEDSGNVGNRWGIDFQGGTVATPPTAATQPAEEITQTAAKMKGQCNPNGAQTTAWFEYGTTTSYGSTTEPVMVGSASDFVDLNHVLSGLVQGATYHYRIAAQNHGGTTYGEDRAFTTLIGQGNLTATPSPNPVAINLPSTISVTVLNGLGNPVGAGQPVTFSTTYPGIFSGNGASSSSSPSTVLTNSSGQTWIWFSSGAVGTANLTVECPNSGSALVPLQIYDPNGTLNIQVTVGFLDGDTTYSAYEIQAVVTNQSGSPVAGQRVDFSTTRGALNPAYDFTGPSGIADTVLTINSSGDVTVTATAGGKSSATSFYGQVGTGGCPTIYPVKSFTLDAAVQGLAFTPDGSTLIANSYNRQLLAWNTSNWSSKWTQQAGNNRQGQLSVSPNNQYFLTCNDDGAEVRYVSNGNYYCVGSNADNKGILGAWTGNSTYMTTSFANVFRHTSACASGTQAYAIPSEHSLERDAHMDFNLTKNWVAFCSDEGDMFVLNTSGSLVRQQTVSAGANAYDTDFSSNGSSLAAVGYMSTVIFNTSTWTSTSYACQSVGNWRYGVTFMDNDTRLAVGGSGKVEIVNVSGGSCYRVANVSGNAVELAWNQSTQELAVGTSTGNLYIFKPHDPVDNISPILSISYPANGLTTNQSQLTTTGRVTDNIGVSSFKINGVNVSLDASGNFSKAITLVEGSNTISYQASDLAGNQTSGSRTVTLIVDHTPPVISGTTASPLSGQAGTVFTIQSNVSDGDSGISSVTAKVKNAQGVVQATLPMSHIGSGVYRASYNSTGLAIGNYVIDITAVDSSPQANTRTSQAAAEFAVVEAPIPPQGCFTFSPEPQDAGKPIQFQDGFSGSPVLWFWEFGDGTTSTLQNPVHTYSSGGVYEVTLTATNSYGSTECTRSVSAVDYALTTSVTAGSGQVSPPGTTRHNPGTQVTLQAFPDPCFVFDGWSGDVQGNINPVTVTVVQDMSIGATFSQELVVGDLDADCAIGATDLQVLADYLAGNGDEKAIGTFQADCNEDGLVDAVDLAILINYLAGNITELPVISAPPVVLFYEGFESNGVGQPPSGWNFNPMWADAGLIRIVNSPVSVGVRALKVEGASAQGVYRANTVYQRDSTVFFDVFVPAGNTNEQSPGYFIYEGIGIQFISNGGTSFEARIQWNTGFAITGLNTDCWYTFSLEIDWDTSKCVLKQDTQVTSPFFFTPNISGGWASAVSLYGNNSSVTNTVYFDEIEILEQNHNF